MKSGLPMQNIQVGTAQNIFIHNPVAAVDGRICNALLAGLSEFYIPQRLCCHPKGDTAISGSLTESPSARFIYTIMNDCQNRATGTQYG
jgi:hypothetical protein